MPRPAGSKNRDFHQKRLSIVEKLTNYALENASSKPSLRQLSQSVDLSEPTLRHYFKDRRGVIIAILEYLNNRARPFWKTLSIPANSVSDAVVEYFRLTDAGFRHMRYARAHVFGMTEGIGDPEVSKAYLKYIVEPTIQAAIDKLSGSDDAPTTPNASRAAAMAMVAPALFMIIHQDMLGGDEVAAVDYDRFFLHLGKYLSEGIAAN